MLAKLGFSGIVPKTLIPLYSVPRAAVAIPHTSVLRLRRIGLRGVHRGEMVEALIEAYGKGEITLPAIKPGTDPKLIRRIQPTKSTLQAVYGYTVMSVAVFLGWTNTSEKTNRTEPNLACLTAFRALDAIAALYTVYTTLR
jgi:hypothetical protein